eukprot:68830_1
MANKPPVEEIKFQSQLKGAALDYYKSLLPDILSISSIDLKDGAFINTLSDESSIPNHYNLNPIRTQSKPITNPIRSQRRNSLNTANKHHIPAPRRNSIAATHPMPPNPHTEQLQTPQPFRLDTNQKHKPFPHQTATPKLIDCVPLCDILPMDNECKEEWMTNLHVYSKKHTELFINVAKRKKRENIDDLNMFKHNINHHIATLITYIVPKLQQLHSKNRVYCHLKPANISMDFDIDPHEPLRFGLNGSVMCHAKNTRLLETDDDAKYIGSVSYNPPEIFVNDKRNVIIDTSFDIWSLGITLLQIINGEHPFLFDLTMEYGASKVMNGELEGVINQAYIDENVMYNHVLIWSKHKLFRDLLLHMLQVNVEERYSIDDIICHKWYQKYCT